MAAFLTFSLTFASTAAASAAETSAPAPLGGYSALIRPRAPLGPRLSDASSLVRQRRSSPLSLLFHPHPLSTGRWSSLPVSASAGPRPPVPEPHGTGLQATFHRIRDGMRIFLAVFFWMFLFFWACAWEGRDDDDRTNKTSSRFRRR